MCNRQRLCACFVCIDVELPRIIIVVVYSTVQFFFSGTKETLNRGGRTIFYSHDRPYMFPFDEVINIYILERSFVWANYLPDNYPSCIHNFTKRN